MGNLVQKYNPLSGKFDWVDANAGTLPFILEDGTINPNSDTIKEGFPYSKPDMAAKAFRELFRSEDSNGVQGYSVFPEFENSQYVDGDITNDWWGLPQGTIKNWKVQQWGNKIYDINIKTTNSAEITGDGAGNITVDTTAGTTANFASLLQVGQALTIGGTSNYNVIGGAVGNSNYAIVTQIVSDDIFIAKIEGNTAVTTEVATSISTVTQYPVAFVGGLEDSTFGFYAHEVSLRGTKDPEYLGGWAYDSLTVYEETGTKNHGEWWKGQSPGGDASATHNSYTNLGIDGGQSPEQYVTTRSNVAGNAWGGGFTQNQLSMKPSGFASGFSRSHANTGGNSWLLMGNNDEVGNVNTPESRFEYTHNNGTSGLANAQWSSYLHFNRFGQENVHLAYKNNIEEVPGSGRWNDREMIMNDTHWQMLMWGNSHLSTRMDMYPSTDTNRVANLILNPEGDTVFQTNRAGGRERYILMNDNLFSWHYNIDTVFGNRLAVMNIDDNKAEIGRNNVSGNGGQGGTRYYANGIDDNGFYIRAGGTGTNRRPGYYKETILAAEFTDPDHIPNVRYVDDAVGGAVQNLNNVLSVNNDTSGRDIDITFGDGLGWQTPGGNEARIALAAGDWIGTTVRNVTLPIPLAGGESIAYQSYVDDAVGGITSAQDWSGIIGGSTDRATDFSGSYTLADLANNFFTLVADLRTAGILQ
jgi:hypothetical protein